MCRFLFLYGTLLPEHAPTEMLHLVARLKFISAGSMPGDLFDLGEFPGAVFDANARHRVWGQMFELPEDAPLLAQLDTYEGYSPNDPAASLFVRQKRPITLPDGSEQLCWVYLYNRPTGQAHPIPSGDYAEWACAGQ